ncbi:TELO2-interacting protein 2-like isoform X2 [Dysidea avara]|uniref:TELO2-interacting protein 2-like isoform X2 n=1 Tax=Dysidea avara TaxID=196820 RepID=UPI00332F23EA
MTERPESQLKRLSLKSYHLVSDKEDKRKELLSQYKQSLSDLLEYTGSDDFTEKICGSKQLPQLIIAVTAHAGKLPWSTTSTRNIVKGILSNVLLKCGCSTVTELLVGEVKSTTKQSPYLPLEENETEDDISTDNPSHIKNFDDCHSQESEMVPTEEEEEVTITGTMSQREERLFQLGIIKNLFSIFKTTLTRDKWLEHPTEQYSLMWCLRSLNHPHISSWIDSFLPPLLMFTDHHELHHKLLGLSGLTHLIRNVNAAEMRWYNRAMVVYEAIHKFLYFGDVNIIWSVHRCLWLLLPIIDGPSPVRVDAPCKAYSSGVLGYIDMMGIHGARHLKRLLHVMYQYLEFPDVGQEECRLNCLRVLVAVMRNVWPRIPYHQADIVKSLIKLVSDCCQANGALPKPKSPEFAVLNWVIKCLTMLQRCCPSLELQELAEGCDHEGLNYCIQQSSTQLSQ